MIRRITTGTVTDLKTGFVYKLGGVKCNNNVILDGAGYFLEIRENKDRPADYILSLVSDDTVNGSVARKLAVVSVILLKDFVYEGKEEV